jgi:hypothetical protein
MSPSALLRRAAPLALLLLAPACLVEYAIGGASASAGSSDDTSHDSDTSQDSDTAHDDTGSDSDACTEGSADCGLVCPEDQVSCAGQCVAPERCHDGQICPDGQVTCDGGCAPAESCCAKACDPVRERCDGGECRCRDGLVLCDGGCVDTRSDPANCGVCGKGCGDQGVCHASDCSEGCGDGQVACDGACVYLATDPLHCDACDKSCAGDELCLAGDCRPYTFAGECATCPCPDDCAGDLAVCCDSTYLGAAVCVDNGCG